MDNILSIINEKKQLTDRLNKLTYGTIQIREEKAGKYIYLYNRISGKLICKYAGEYSAELYNVILENNKVAKEYKKRIKEIDKSLKSLNYEETKTNDKIDINIALAKRNLVDSIYKQSILEGIATTYSDTETIINEGIINNMKSDDVTKILNMKHAWEFILDNDVLQYSSSFTILTQINYLIEENLLSLNGKVRPIPVKIGGTTYIPPIPFESQIIEDLQGILNKEPSIDNAIEIALYVMKKQVFIDGNKRTAIIFANHYLVKNGLGLLVVPSELVSEFKNLLILYYENKETKSIKCFLKSKCWIKI